MGGFISKRVKRNSAGPAYKENDLSKIDSLTATELTVDIPTSLHQIGISSSNDHAPKPHARKERPPEIQVSRFQMIEMQNEKYSQDRPSATGANDSKSSDSAVAIGYPIEKTPDDSASETSTSVAARATDFIDLPKTTTVETIKDVPSAEVSSAKAIPVQATTRPSHPIGYQSSIAIAIRPPPSPLPAIHGQSGLTGIPTNIPPSVPEMHEMYEEATEEVSLGSLSSLDEVSL
mmetsp:Transcript_30919/g.82921  ORF Transcript_30919/g.82921 Transcript_30919/m.82921 type:complete len:233 (-) Transcript_30919:3561-4259(-)